MGRQPLHAQARGRMPKNKVSNRPNLFCPQQQTDARSFRADPQELRHAGLLPALGGPRGVPGPQGLSEPACGIRTGRVVPRARGQGGGLHGAVRAHDPPAADVQRSGEPRVRLLSRGE